MMNFRKIKLANYISLYYNRVVNFKSDFTKHYTTLHFKIFYGGNKT